MPYELRKDISTSFHTLDKNVSIRIPNDVRLIHTRRFGFNCKSIWNYTVIYIYWRPVGIRVRSRKKCFIHPHSSKNNSTITWLKYCRYGVKLYPINRKITWFTSAKGFFEIGWVVLKKRMKMWNLRCRTYDNVGNPRLISPTIYITCY